MQALDQRLRKRVGTIGQVQRKHQMLRAVGAGPVRLSPEIKDGHAASAGQGAGQDIAIGFRPDRRDQDQIRREAGNLLWQFMIEIAPLQLNALDRKSVV